VSASATPPAGTSPAGSRVARLAGDLGALGVEALLVDSLVDVRYLTGFTGSNAAVLVVAEAASAALGAHRFMTDFRYRTQSREQVPDEFAREIVADGMSEAIAAALAAAPSGRLGFDEAKMSVKAHRTLAEKLPHGWALVPAAGAVERMRAVKEEQEIARIRAAAELADEAMRGILEGGLAGRSEREVALELELSMRRLGAEAPSFGSIVAAGAHGALPHAEPSAQEIAADVLVTIDWGAQLDGYCSDCTRTYATGEGISALARETYELVLDAQQRALAAVSPERNGRELDAVAREVIERAGQGENFGHGLGHGVGMEIHEAPRLSRTAGEDPLQAGNVVTVEPGVYLPGELGVRIEDLVVVRPDGPDVLTGLSKELTVVT
jgi:Xaa-Pro aminopeptidase